MLRKVVLFLLACLAILPVHAQSNLIVRVMAANITSGSFQSYEAPGIRIFQGLKPDIIAIQEFKYNNSTADAQLRQLVDTAFGTNFSYFRETGYVIPNGIVSRWPILESGSWPDGQVPNRGFAWALVDLPGTNDLYVVSVHLHSSGGSSSRAIEATNLKSLIQSNFPANAWIILAGDFNTDTRTEAAVTTFKTFLSDNPIPADQSGDPDTNEPRNKPYDYVLCSFSLTNLLTPVAIGTQQFPNGLVFDSRDFTPLSAVAPVQSGDSGVSGMQHMAVVKDFNISYSSTNIVANAPAIVSHPQNQSVTAGDNATFTVVATGTPPLSYQWRFNGTNIAGVNADNYTRTNAQPADAGDYSLVVTNIAGTAISSNATLTVNAPLMITAQPQGQSVLVGTDATFSVTAEGTPPISYQWRFNSTNIAGATSSSYTRTNAQATHAGNYTVVVTNVSGSLTSSVAALTVVSDEPVVIAQWNFNSTPPDSDGATGTRAPSVGSGSTSYAGGTGPASSGEFASGDNSLDPAATTDNSAWNTSSYPAQGIGNKTAGPQFNVSTVGKQNIVVSWSQRSSNTGNKYTRLQYTTNATTFIDFPAAVTGSTAFVTATNNLSGISGVRDNPDFAFRIVAEFESTAIGNANAIYVAANTASTYGTSGTVRFDMVTVTGVTIPPTNPPAGPAVLSSPFWSTNHQFGFTLSGTTGSNYIIQASPAVTVSNWVSLITNAAPFTFVDTNAGALTQRLYRAVSAP